MEIFIDSDIVLKDLRYGEKEIYLKQKYIFKEKIKILSKLWIQIFKFSGLIICSENFGKEEGKNV